MSMQLRQPGTDVILSPTRDLRYCYPDIVKQAVARLNAKAWPALFDVQEKLGDSNWDDLCDANEAYIQFLNKSCDNPEQTLADILEEVGWNKIPETARVLYCSALGQVLTCQLFMALRDTTDLGNRPKGIAALIDHVITRTPPSTE